MKSQFIATVAAVVLPWCATTQSPAISIHEAARDGNIEAVKQHFVSGADMNVKCSNQNTPLDVAIKYKRTEIADLLRKHGARQVKN